MAQQINQGQDKKAQCRLGDCGCILNTAVLSKLVKFIHFNLKRFLFFFFLYILRHFVVSGCLLGMNKKKTFLLRIYSPYFCKATIK